MLICLLAAIELAAAEKSVDPIPRPDVIAIHEAILTWVGENDANLLPESRRLLSTAGPDAATPSQLDALLRVTYLGSEEVRNLVDAATADRWSEVDLETPSLKASQVVATNLKLFLGKTLIDLGATDEAEELVNSALEEHCIAPASLIFCRAVCQHARLDKAEGLKSLARLLDPASVVPERYRALARLMQQDLQDLEDNDLAKTARQMKNLQQKLQRGKSGKKTQEQEQEILQKLDKLIEKMEQQQKQMQGQGGQPGGNNPQSPADESRIGGQKGPGEVDRRPIGKSSGWGNLPEKARTEARNLINRQFPSHYRRAVEEYLKKLAERPAN